MMYKHICSQMNVAIAAVIAGVLGTGGEIMPLLGFMTRQRC